LFEVGNKFVIAHLTKVKNKGTIPMEYIKTELEAAVRKEKKAEMLMEKMKAASASNIDQLAQKLGIEDFIVHFKKGFDHVIEPIGKKTPHSTIRKILLLRALSGKKNLLLLDHPWNGLEASSAEKIKNYLLSDHLQSTCVIISNDQAFNQKTALQLNFKNGKSV
jgi:ABC-type transport system involved in cytochrome bd biosynthesis fused ATPase/permease subunit